MADQSRKDETKMVNIIEVGLFVLKRHLNLLIFRHRGTSSGPFLSSWRSLKTYSGSPGQGSNCLPQDPILVRGSLAYEGKE